MKKTTLLTIGAMSLLALAACSKKESTQETATTPNTETAAAPSAPALPAIAPSDLGSFIQTLASDEFEGRAPASKGGQKTREWLQNSECCMWTE